MKIKDYKKPTTNEEALTLIREGGTVIGGGTWLKLLPKEIDTAVDLGQLDFKGIHVGEDVIEVGSMVTLRELELEPAVNGLADGILVKAINRVMGVPFRNIATIGGTVVGKYGFSDIITPLLALDTVLVFMSYGELALEDYLEGQYKEKDLLISIRIKNEEARGAFETIKKTSNDFPILNAAVTKTENHYRVAVGARPGVAALSHEAMALLNSLLITDDFNRTLSIEKVQMAGELASAELSFGTNARASEIYREHLCETLVSRCVLEVQ